MDDPFLWLEDINGAEALRWVETQNAHADEALASTTDFQRMESDIRTILDSDEKIPALQKIGAYYYNFWRDKDHERGVWRRTTLDQYRREDTRWETVLDIDALNRTENENWVWHGAECLRPDYSRCLIALSRGGADADVTREFDLERKTWVENGFYRPEAKGGLTWIDRDTVYIYSDFGPGTQTESGYPRIVKKWRRGTPLTSATEVYAGRVDDMYIAAYHDDTPGFERDFVSRTIAFYNDELYLRTANGELIKIDAPNSANKHVHRQWLTLELRDAWTVAGRTYASGALLVIDFDAFMSGDRSFQVIFEPSETRSLTGMTWTRNYLILNVLDNVKNRLEILAPGMTAWQRQTFVSPTEFSTIGITAVDAQACDALWMTDTDFLTPTTFSWFEIGYDPEPLKTMPNFFDSGDAIIEQHFAVSEDGTRVPYFLVRPAQMAFDGTHPTLLYGYGGFEVALTPNYSGTVGKAWIERGGIYVVANIRGGGEYGPRWHQAALKQNRHKAYQDFAAVAQDLIATGVTSPPHLGIQGGSNGGLLMGNMLTHYPQLFGAIVIQVPLLDMKRYNKLLAGASWVAEYGNPDTDDWHFIRTFSPYHQFDAEKTYPPTLFLTSTRDDRVHPGHARKMAARMLAAGKDIRYYENIEGGHGGAANNAQAAHMAALAYTFLWLHLQRP